METLVLNKCTVPVSVIPSRRATTLVTSNKAIILQTYEDTWMRSSGSIIYNPILMKSHNSVISMMVPSVIQCTDSDFMPRKYTNILPFNRKNVYLRDHGQCCYCGKKVSLSGFTFDHVVPKCQGGKVCWENIVVSCLKCNGQKGKKSLKSFHRKLYREPYAPRLTKAAPAYLVNRIPPEIPIKTWRDYIYWEVILID